MGKLSKSNQWRTDGEEEEQINGGVCYVKNFNVESKMSFYVDKNELGDLCRMAKRLKGFYVDMTPPPDAIGGPS